MQRMRGVARSIEAVRKPAALSLFMFRASADVAALCRRVPDARRHRIRHADRMIRAIEASLPIFMSERRIAFDALRCRGESAQTELARPRRA